MKMLVLAGGLGTRLREVVSHVPKPMAPVGDHPFLYFQLENWIAQGVNSFVFLLHYQADIIQDFLKAHSQTLLASCEVLIVIEPERLDTGGAVAYAVRKLSLSEDIIITNADTWLGSGIKDLMSVGPNSMLIIKQKDVSRFGQIEVDSHLSVTAFREKGEFSGEGWINAGMCILQASQFSNWDGKKISLERDIFPQLLQTKQLRAVPVTCEFIDIGVPDEYRRFCTWQLNGRKDKLCK